MDERVADVLGFWFGDPADDATMAQRQARLWWSKDAAVDGDMRSRFAGLLQQAVAGALDHWAESQPGLLALIVLTDQFPRNIHRGTPLAFCADEQARHWARLALERDAQASLRPLERVFSYLPFEHSEVLADQELAVALFETLAREMQSSGLDASGSFASFADYARRHHEVVRRFGRFPHRNVILGRASTAEEIEFLKQPGSSF